MTVEYNWNKFTCFYIRFGILKIAALAMKLPTKF